MICQFLKVAVLSIGHGDCHVLFCTLPSRLSGAECQGIDTEHKLLLEIILFYTLLSAGPVVCSAAWRLSSVYRV